MAFVSAFRGVPVNRYSRTETIIAYWILGLYWGKAVSQNKKGHLIGHIKVCKGFADAMHTLIQNWLTDSVAMQTHGDDLF